MTSRRVSGELPRPLPSPASFAGMRVGVVGFGIEGRDAAGWLVSEGASVRVIDRRAASEVSVEVAEALGDASAEVSVVGQEDAGVLEGLDAVVASQGVPHGTGLLRRAACLGLPVYGPTAVALDRCLGLGVEVVGITGSAGKTTTTLLTARMLEAGGRHVVVGGNMGTGLLERLSEVRSETVVVAELSHTQLLRTASCPTTAALLNVAPNHLDQFSWDEYRGLKERIVSGQRVGDTAVLPWDDVSASELRTRARVVRWGEGEPGPELERAAYADAGAVWWRDGGTAQRVADVGDLRIPGRHNLRNALAATAVAGSLGVDAEAIGAALRTFDGVAHRLQLVGEADGVRFVDDSIATTPERTLAGLLAIEGPVVLLMGGRGKNLPLEPLFGALRERVRTVALFGEAGAVWRSELEREGIATAGSYGTLEEAFAAAVAAAESGDTVLLSPAGTSFDQYANFEARGAHFSALVMALGTEAGS